MFSLARSCSLRCGSVKDLKQINRPYPPRLRSQCGNDFSMACWMLMRVRHFYFFVFECLGNSHTIRLFFMRGHAAGQIHFSPVTLTCPHILNEFWMSVISWRTSGHLVALNPFWRSNYVNEVRRTAHLSRNRLSDSYVRFPFVSRFCFCSPLQWGNLNVSYW